MKSLVDQLSQYAAYHRDGRNIALHMIGIPLIVCAVEILLSRATIDLATIIVTPAMLLSILATLFYLRLDLRFGLVMAVLLGLAAWAGIGIVHLGTTAWLVTGIGLFVIGWIFQLIGHAYEGRKPAFLDDVIGLLVGPLFIVAEIAFLLGLRHDLRRAIRSEARHI